MSTALAKAMQGEKISEKAAPGALAQAVEQLTKAKAKVGESKEMIKATGMAVVETGVFQGALFLGGMAKGALGEWMTPVAGVDVRPVLGGIALTWGFYEVVTGGSYGNLALAAGNGLVGSWTVEMGNTAGAALKDAWSKKGAEAPAPGAPAAKNNLGGPVREVTLTGDRRRLAPARRRNRGDDF